MRNWYWRNYLERDDLRGFARLWRKMGISIGFWWLFFFLVGGASWFIGMCCLRALPDDRMTLVVICALLSSAAFGLAAFLYAGMAVASVAHSTQRRLEELEGRLRKLEGVEADVPQPEPEKPHRTFPAFSHLLKASKVVVCEQRLWLCAWMIGLGAAFLATGMTVIKLSQYAGHHPDIVTFSALLFMVYMGSVLAMILARAISLKR